MYRVFVVVAALAASAIAVPTGSLQSCAARCEHQDKFFYQIGSSYVYNYEVTTGTGFSAYEEHDSKPGVQVKAKVHVQPISPCEYHLTLSDVVVPSSAKSQDFTEEVTRHPIRFVMQNGKIESVCTSSDESVWVTNFKKAIISSLQNSMTKTDQSYETVQETDVSGECETEYRTTKSYDGMTVIKSKSPTKCSQRPQTSSSLNTFGINLDSVVDGMEPLTGKQVCTQDLQGGIIRHSQCLESFTFKPFAHSNGGQVETHITVTMELQTISEGERIYPHSLSEKSHLVYQKTDEEKEEGFRLVKEIVEKLEVASENGIKKDVPQLFSQLVSVLKSLSVYEIRQVYSSVEGKHTAKFIMDAMPLVGTEASTRFIASLIIEGKYSEEDKNLYYTSLAFVKKPTLETFEPLLEILKHEYSQKAMLGVSSLVNNYCSEHSQCSSQNVIKSILEHFESYMGASCRSRDESERNKIVVALKAIGNAGRFIDGETILRRCYTEINPNEVRVAAIEAYRNAPCDYNRKGLLSIFEDNKYDSEIRIAAYLQVMKCPTKQLVETIKDRLTSEGVNHVSSFVWSHLSNIQESASQSKQWIKDIIGNDMLHNKFTAETLKFSKYFESSIYSKEMDVGGSVDADIVFSKESFLPRSAMLNFTVDLFGKAVNLFEIGGRMEDYEYFIEKFFGPHGYYPEETVEQLIKNMRQSKKQDSEYIDNSIEGSHDPRASVYVKLLGKELFYSNHVGANDILSQFGIVNPIDLIKQFMSTGQVNFMKSFNFVNSRFSLPTVSGFPLRLNYDGTASVGFMLNGKFHVNGLSSFNIDGVVKPSTAVTIDSSMVIDAFVTKAGRRFTTTLHSSTVAEGQVKVKDSRIVDFSVRVPDENMNVYEYSHDIIRIDDNKAEKESHEEHAGSICYPQGGIFGITFCRDFSSYLGTTTSDRLVLKKLDTHKSYDFRYVNDKGEFSVTLDMPNSRESKKHQLYFYSNGMKFDAGLKYPGVDVGAKGLIDLGSNPKQAKLEVKLADGKVYDGVFTLEDIKTMNERTFKPSLVLRRNGAQISEVVAKISNNFKDEVITVEGAHNGKMILPSGDFKFTYYYTKHSSEKEAILEFSTYTKSGRNIVKGKLHGQGDISESHVRFNLKGDYKLYEQESKSASALLEYHKEKGTKGSVHTVSLEVPYYNIKSHGEIALLDDSYKVSGEIECPHCHYSFESFYSKKEIGFTKEIAGKIWFENKNRGVSYGVQKTVHVRENGIETEAKVKLHTISLNHKFTIVYNQNLNYDMVLNMGTANNGMDIEVKLNMQNEGNGKIVYGALIDSALLGVESKGVVHNKSTRDHFDVEIINQVNKAGILFSNGYSADFNARMKASKEQFQFLLNIDSGSRYFRLGGSSMEPLSNPVNVIHIQAHARPTSFNFESNVYYPFKFSAEIEKKDEQTYIEGVAEWDINKITMAGSYSKDHVRGNFRSNEKTVEIYGSIKQDEFVASLEYDIAKKFAVVVKYDTQYGKFFSIGIQTPFEGYRRQMAGISYNLSQSHLEHAVNLLWDNEQRFDIKGEYKWDIQSIKNHKITGKLEYNSSIDKFERAIVELQHEFKSDHRSTVMNTSVKGHLNRSVVIGNLEYVFDGDSVKFFSSYQSPFTKSFSIEFNAEKYPRKEVFFNIVYNNKQEVHIKFTRKQQSHSEDIYLVAQIPRVPNVDLKALLNYVASGADVSVRGTIGEGEINIDSKCLVEYNNGETTYKLDGKISHPFLNSPLSANAAVIYTRDNMVEIDFDMSPEGYSRTNQAVKFHANTNLLHSISPSNIYLVGYYTGYDTKLSVNVIYLVRDTKIDSTISASYNSKSIKVSTRGFYDAEAYTGEISASVESSYDFINGMHGTVKHSKEGNARNTVVKYRNDNFDLDIYHRLRLDDSLNWKNELSVGDYFSLKNKMASVHNHNRHDIKIEFLDTKLKGSFNRENNNGDVKISLQAPYMNDVQIEASKDFINNLNHFNVEVFYGDNQVINSKTEYSISNDIHLKSVTKAPQLWQYPLEVQFKMQSQYDKKVKFAASLGNNEKVEVDFYQRDSEIGGRIFTKRSNVQNVFQIKHESNQQGKTTLIDGTYNNEKFSALIKFWGRLHKGNMESELHVPHMNIHNVKANIDYNLVSTPKKFKGKFVSNNEVNEVYAEVNENSLNGKIKRPSGDISLDSEWKLNHNSGKFVAHVKSLKRQSKIELTYNIGEQTEFNVFSNCGSQEFSLNGVFAEGKVVVDAQVLEDNYHFSGIKLPSKAEVIMKRNERFLKVNIGGEYNEQYGQVEANLKMKDFNGEKSMTVSSKYDFRNGHEMSVESQFFKQTYSFSFNNVKAGEIVKNTLQIKSPFNGFENILIHATRDFSEQKSKHVISVFVNSKQVSSFSTRLSKHTISVDATYVNSNLVANLDLQKLEGNAVFEKQGVEALKIRYNPSEILFALHDQDISNDDIEVEVSNQRHRNGNSFNISLSLNNVKYIIEGKVDTYMNIPKVNLIHKKIENNVVNKLYSIDISADFVDGTDFSFEFNGKSERYYIKWNSNLQNSVDEQSKYHRTVEVKGRLPFESIKNVELKGEYLLSDEEFKVDIKTNLDKTERENRFFVAGKINKESVSLKLETPFEILRNAEFSGEYRHEEDVYQLTGKVNDEYEIEGKLTQKQSGYVFETVVPYQNSKFNFRGELSKETATFELINQDDSSQKTFVQYELQPNEISFDLYSPYKHLSQLRFNVKSICSDGICNAHVQFSQNEHSLHVSTKTKFLSNVYDIQFNVEVPDDKFYKFGFVLDTASDKKTFAYSYENEEDHHFAEANVKFVREQNIGNNYYSALVQFESSVPQIEKIKLTFDATALENEFSSEISVGYNDVDYEIAAEYENNDNKLHLSGSLVNPLDGNILKFTTSFGKNSPSIKAEVVVKDQVFVSDIKIKFNEIQVNIATPYEEARKINLEAGYEWEPNQKSVKLNVDYNEPIVKFGAGISTDVRKPSIFFNIKSRAKEEVKLVLSYDSINTEDMVNIVAHLSNENSYALVFGYALQPHKVGLKMKYKSPFQFIMNIKEFDIDTEVASDTDGNRAKLFIQTNGKIHADIQGKYLDDETSFKFSVPTESYGLVHTQTSYNRNKRSVEFRMQNDHHDEVGIIANFHSLEVNLQSPFKRLKKVSLSVKKDQNGKWTVNYKRNEYYLNYEIGRTKKGIEMKGNAAIPSWELLALTGRLSDDELEGYIKGTLPETQLTLNTKGVLGKKKGEIKWDWSAPDLPTLKQASAKFDYNVRKGVYTYNAKSSTNKNFKIFLEFKRGGLFIDVFIPHKEQPTVANGQLTIFKGNLNIKSRFPILKSYSLKYAIKLRTPLSAKIEAVRNGVKVFLFEADIGGKVNHVMLEIRRRGNYFKIHYHRKGWENLEAIIHRNGHEISVNMNGSGNLPEKGEIAFVLKNSFRVIPKEVKGTISVDRTGSPKVIIIKTESGADWFKEIRLNYNIDLKNLKRGDFDLQFDTIKDIDANWKNIKAQWKFDNKKNGDIKITVGPNTLKLKGKMTLKHTDIIAESSRKWIGKRAYGWKCIKYGENVDYMIKFGPADRPTLFVLKGVINDLRNADVEGTVQSRFHENPINFKLKWSGNKDIGISGEGSFDVGRKNGKFVLHRLKRDPIKRASKFKLTGTSNIKNWSKYTIEGEYDLSIRFVDINIAWDNDRFALKTQISNLDKEKSENSATFNIPGKGAGSATFGHDFSDPLNLKMTVRGTLGGKDFHYIEKLSRNKENTVFDYSLDIKSNFIGIIKANGHLDIQDLKNANGYLNYSRDGANNINVKWFRKQTDNSIDNELKFDSQSELVRSFKFYYNVDWNVGEFLNAKLGIDSKGKKIEAVLVVVKGKANLNITTPFVFTDDIEAEMKWDLKNKKKKTISLNYARGSRKLNLSVVLKTPKDNKGSLDIDLSTPFGFAKKVTFDAKWQNGQFTATYQRNQKKINFKGNANLKLSKSSFEVEFDPPNLDPVKIKFNYDLGDFVKRQSKKEDRIMEIEIRIGEKFVQLDIDGFASREKAIVTVNGSSSLKAAKSFYVKLDSELNLSDREGSIHIKINDFEYIQKNKFQKFDGGFYLRTQIQSTLTDLPGVTFGYGKNGETRTLTLGWGDEREISISFNGKDKFKKGFYGKIDLPKRGITDLEYDVDYEFRGDNKLYLHAEIKLKSGKKIVYEIDYHSDGVKARLAPFRFLRQKRSINDEYFYGDDIVFSKSNSQSNVKGIILGGELFGFPFGVEAILDTNKEKNSEGKLIIQTPFEGYETVGGHFKIIKENKIRVVGQLFFNGESNIDFEIDNNGKEIKGEVFNNGNGSDAKPLALNFHIRKEYEPLINFEVNVPSVINTSFKANKNGINVVYNEQKVEIIYDITSEAVNIGAISSVNNVVIHKLDLESLHDQKQNKIDVSLDVSLHRSSHVVNLETLITKNEQNLLVKYDGEYKRKFAIEFENNQRNKHFSYKKGLDPSHEVLIEIVPCESILVKFDSVGLPKINIVARNVPRNLNIDASVNYYGKVYSVSVEGYHDRVNIGVRFDSYHINSLQMTYGISDIFARIVATTNNKEHVLHFDLSPENNFSGSFEISSPYLTFKKAYLSLQTNNEDVLDVQIKGRIQEEIHALHIRGNNVERAFSLTITSPFIPSGHLKADMKLDGNNLRQITAVTHIELFSDTFYVTFETDFINSVHKHFTIDARTPILKYPHVQFGAGYNYESLNKFYMFANPFNLKFNVLYGFENDSYKAGFEVSPGLSGVQPYAASAVIPLNKFNPQFSAKLSNVEYKFEMVYNNTDEIAEASSYVSVSGIERKNRMYYTKNFPVEIGYEAKNPVNQFSSKDINIHIMVDSSFLIAKDALYLLL